MSRQEERRRSDQRGFDPMAVGKSNQPGPGEPGYDWVAWDSCPELMRLAARRTQVLRLNDEREASNG